MITVNGVFLMTACFVGVVVVAVLLWLCFVLPNFARKVYAYNLGEFYRRRVEQLERENYNLVREIKEKRSATPVWSVPMRPIDGSPKTQLPSSKVGR
jgi:uncharacterized membrane protein